MNMFGPNKGSEGFSPFGGGGYGLPLLDAGVLGGFAPQYLFPQGLLSSTGLGLPPHQHVVPGGPLLDPLAQFHLGPTRPNQRMDLGAHMMSDMQPKAQVCFDYCKGQCRRGASCKYSHDVAAAVAFNNSQGGQGQSNSPLASSATPRQPTSSTSNSTPKGQSVCFDYIRGQCRRGGECKYSHDPGVIAHTAQSRAQTNPTEICLDFSRGRCVRGALCKYSHDMRLIQTTSLSRFMDTAKREQPLGVGLPGSGPAPGGDLSPTILAAASAAGSDIDALTEHLRRMLDERDSKGGIPRSDKPRTPTSAAAAYNPLLSPTAEAEREALVRAVLNKMMGGVKTAPPKLAEQVEPSPPSSDVASSLGMAMEFAAITAAAAEVVAPAVAVGGATGAPAAGNPLAGMDPKDLATIMANIQNIQQSMAAIANGSAPGPQGHAEVGLAEDAEMEAPRLRVAVLRPSLTNTALPGDAASPCPGEAGPSAPRSDAGSGSDDEEAVERMEAELMAALAKVKKLKEKKAASARSAGGDNSAAAAATPEWE